MYTKRDLLEDPRFVNADPDEPVFLLFGRDESAPTHVRNWAMERRSNVSLGKRPVADTAQVDYAFGCATAMEDWREDANEGWRNGLFRVQADRSTETEHGA